MSTTSIKPIAIKVEFNNGQPEEIIQTQFDGMLGINFRPMSIEVFEEKDDKTYSRLVIAPSIFKTAKTVYA